MSHTDAQYKFEEISSEKTCNRRDIIESLERHPPKEH